MEDGGLVSLCKCVCVCVLCVSVCRYRVMKSHIIALSGHVILDSHPSHYMLLALVLPSMVVFLCVGVLCKYEIAHNRVIRPCPPSHSTPLALFLNSMACFSLSLTLSLSLSLCVHACVEVS